jgi:hypothetical protein
MQEIFNRWDVSFRKASSSNKERLRGASMSDISSHSESLGGKFWKGYLCSVGEDTTK